MPPPPSTIFGCVNVKTRPFISLPTARRQTSGRFSGINKGLQGLQGFKGQQELQSLQELQDLKEIKDLKDFKEFQDLQDFQDLKEFQDASTSTTSTAHRQLGRRQCRLRRLRRQGRYLYVVRRLRLRLRLRRDVHTAAWFWRFLTAGWGTRLWAGFPNCVAGMRGVGCREGRRASNRKWPFKHQTEVGTGAPGTCPASLDP